MHEPQVGGPEVSIVVPVFNGADFLAEALASIEAQAEVELEIVVVDDGSQDGSATIARSKRGVRLLQQANQGAAAAKNAGVAAARGTYLAFLDADDRWPAGTLAERRKHLLASRADIVFGRMREFGLIGKSMAENTRSEALAGLVAGTMLLRRADFLRVGMFDTRFAYGEFIDWYARAQTKGLVASHFDDIALERRIHERNAGRNVRDAQRGYAEVVRAALARRRAKGSGA